MGDLFEHFVDACMSDAIDYEVPILKVPAVTKYVLAKALCIGIDSRLTKILKGLPRTRVLSLSS